MSDKDPRHECLPLHKKTANEGIWWSQGAWVPPTPRPVQARPNFSDPLLRWQSPNCKHDRCADTQYHCEECTRHSKVMVEEWRKEWDEAWLKTQTARRAGGDDEPTPLATTGEGNPPSSPTQGEIELPLPHTSHEG